MKHQEHPVKTVWIVNHYAHHRERDGRATRHQHLAAGLPDSGWHAVVIAAGTDHPTGRAHLRGVRLRERWAGDDHEFCWLRGVDHRGHGIRRTLRRLADIGLFTALLLVPGMLRGLPHPDVVVGGSFHPLAAWAASVLARRHHVPFVFEPRDLWPESAVALTRMSERHPVVRVLRLIERTTIARAVHVVSPLDGVGRYYADRGQPRPFTWVPNGVDPDEPTQPGPQPRRPNQDQDQDQDQAPFTVAYIGSMGTANALETVIDGFAAAHRRNPTDGPQLTLRMVGDGPDRDALRQRVSRLPAGARVIWDGRVSQDEARDIGRSAGCLVVAVHDLPLYRHGVSLNKQYEYMLTGRPLLVASPVVLAPVAAARCGVHVAPDAPDALADGILALARMPEHERAAMGARGREHVLREHDYRALARRYGAALDAAWSAGRSRA
ncbi:glycosyltransferase family 4 protein [Curtobacterium sp. ZW137]|uniref:glycosyltransferase family 4 protein n=1 Tax=Curtobacterium sp. ZW137 TaxID=2485104 RepID=UPI000FB0E04E|nr:glycosyltransferase family 4 protein [Curtobacterium sp. ZW137]ROP65138.1 glycosyltransferase involved in cell wall biosynthesis [Curtobacterium sp. ZW137]